MANSVRSVIQGGSIPTGWMVFRAQKGKATAKGFMAILWGIFFLGMAAVALFWLGSSLGPMKWYIAGFGTLIGLFYLGSGVNRLREAAFGAIALTDDALVIVRGGKEERYTYAQLNNTKIVHVSGQGMPFTRLCVIDKQGKEFFITEGTVFGDPEQIGSAIRAKLK